MTAVTCRDRGPDEAGPSSIFILGDELGDDRVAVLYDFPSNSAMAALTLGMYCP